MRLCLGVSIIRNTRGSLIIKMLFRTHVLFGALVWFLLERFIEMPLYVLGFVLLGAVVVDVDVKNSRFGNRWYFRPLQWMTKHRGVIHSLVAGLFLSLIVGVFSLWAGFGFGVGYVSHLLMDCFTLAGVRLFWPLKFRLRGFVKSGGWVEDVIFVFVLCLDVWLGFNYLF